MPWQPSVFQLKNFMSVAHCEFWGMSTSGPFSSLCKSFFMMFIHLALSVMFFCSHIWLQNYFVSFASDCWIHLVHSSIISRIFCRYFGMSCFVCIAWNRLLNFTTFTKICWFISSSCIDRLVCSCLLLPMQNSVFFIPRQVPFLFQCPSLISLASFGFLLGFLMRVPTSMTSSASAEISSFPTVMSIGIFSQ